MGLSRGKRRCGQITMFFLVMSLPESLIYLFAMFSAMLGEGGGVCELMAFWEKWKPPEGSSCCFY